MDYIYDGLYVEVGKKLRTNREEKGVTLSEAASALGVTPMTIQRYETGKRKISVETIRRLCHYLKIDADELMQDVINNQGINSVLSSSEFEILTTYRQLNSDGQKKLIEYAQMLLKAGYDK